MTTEAAAPFRRCVHETPWPSYALAWANRPGPKFRLAVGSCLEHESNRIQVVQVNEETRACSVTAEVEHAFPPTKLMWGPQDRRSNLLAASGTMLSLYKLDEDGQMKLFGKLCNVRKQETPSQRPPGVGSWAPVTSFDWSVESPQFIGTASIDTTCTIWNIEKMKIETQLIAHDQAVYDITFAQQFLFASCGADGSMRLFDQRDLEHSTIIYESCPSTPLLRLAWNKINKNHIATLGMDAQGVTIIDIRRPSTALVSLAHGDACVNAMAWAPYSRNNLLCGNQDGQALIWDLKEASATVDDTAASMGRLRAPQLLVHGCSREIYQVQWPVSQPEWVALGMNSRLEVLKI